MIASPDNTSHPFYHSKINDPFDLFKAWYNEMLDNPPADPSATILSTSNGKGIVSSRVILLKGFDTEGFLFFTNYNSRKAHDIEENPHAAMLFWWPGQRRQVRLEGQLKKAGRKESEDYFNTRPLETRLGAWASEQSSSINSRSTLTDRLEEFRRQFGDNPPCPPHWGGFRLIPRRFEFWEEGEYRLHHRFIFHKTTIGWETKLLAP